ncbi:hypothetical protein cypCar_00036465 [Cyprinus carpio]|nr:hypothetical protein cypCar_00036465 [Cyprinus carpio]
MSLGHFIIVDVEWESYKNTRPLITSLLERSCRAGQSEPSHGTGTCSQRRTVLTSQPFSEIPGHERTAWANLYTFWKMDGLRNIHRIMVHNFNMHGPIYR